MHYAYQLDKRFHTHKRFHTAVSCVFNASVLHAGARGDLHAALCTSLHLLAGEVVGDGRLQPRRLRVEVLEFLALLRLELPPLDGLGEQRFPVSNGMCVCVVSWVWLCSVLAGLGSICAHELYASASERL